MRSFATFKLSAHIPLSESIGVISTLAIRVLVFLVLASVWNGVHSENAGSAQYLVAYTAMAQALGPLLQPTTSLSEDLANGTIADKLLWPVNLAGFYVSQWLGKIAISLLMGGVAILLCWHILFGGTIDPLKLPLFFISLIIGTAVGIEIDFLFSMLVIRVSNETWFVNAIRTSIVAILSGSVIPLAVLPHGLRTLLTYTPFASMANIPIESLVNDNFRLSELAVQILWLVALALLMIPIYRIVHRRIVVSGG